MMLNVIALKYPGIQNVVYWNTQYDGTPWKDPYDGLVWENTSIPKPSAEDIAQWTKDYDLIIRQQQAVEKRQYPSIGEQLDMMYHDQRDKTTVWKDAITAVKAAHPKPVI